MKAFTVQDGFRVCLTKYFIHIAGENVWSMKLYEIKLHINYNFPKYILSVMYTLTTCVCIKIVY